MEKRTDLAVEAHELYRKRVKTESVPGVETDVENYGDVSVTRVYIKNKSGENALGKPVGKYITIEIPELIHKTIEIYEKTVRILTDELLNIIDISPDACVLVVGLGNRNITADALGPAVVSQLLITRHLFLHLPEEIEDGVRPVCAVSPGVLGITGIETGEMLKGICEKIKPDMIIVIDALASRKLSRVSTTIQLSNTGLTPGSGIGNVRMGINEETMGVPVVAIGVPTVVDAATMANDTIDMVIDKLSEQADKGGNFYKALKNLDRNEKYALISEVLAKEYLNLVVTPKEVDEIIDDISEIIASSINAALHSGVTVEDINRYK